MSTFIGNALIVTKPHHPILQYTLQMILRNHGDKESLRISRISLPKVDLKQSLKPTPVFFPSLSIKPRDRMKM